MPVYQGRYADLVRHLAMQSEIRFFENCLHAPGPVLEFAALGGSMAEALAERGIAVVAGHAFGRTPSSLGSSDGVSAVGFRLSDPCFLPSSFGAIAAWHVLEHLAQPKEALLAMRDLLSEGGRLILKIPNVDCWQALLLGNAWNGFDVPRHPFGFGMRQIEALLEHCGFEVLRRTHLSLIPDSAHLVTSLWPRLNPSLRRLRTTPESTFTAIWKDFLFIALSAAALPLMLLEAASGVGATLLIEACRAGEEDSGPQQAEASATDPPHGDSGR